MKLKLPFNGVLWHDVVRNIGGKMLFGKEAQGLLNSTISLYRAHQCFPINSQCQSRYAYAKRCFQFFFLAGQKIPFLKIATGKFFVCATNLYKNTNNVIRLFLTLLRYISNIAQLL